MSETINGSGNQYGGYTINWKADEVKRQVMENVSKAWNEFAFTVEGESKKELRRSDKKTGKKHGVATGTLRRSIHVAEPGYDWGSDDIEPSPGTPERGGSQVEPEPRSDTLTLEVGSGMVYAMAVHQGHHSFAGYHYLTNGLKKAKEKLDSILRKYRLQR